MTSANRSRTDREEQTPSGLGRILLTEEALVAALTALGGLLLLAVIGDILPTFLEYLGIITLVAIIATGVLIITTSK